jgi:hypothetical protein
MKALMRKPFILDGRNLYNPEALSELGMAYQGIGRRNHLVPLLTFDPVLNQDAEAQEPMMHRDLMAHA